MEIRRFETGDEVALSALIRRTLLEVNGDDSRREVEYLYARYTPETVADNAHRGHTYVLTGGGAILGTGTILATAAEESEILGLFLASELVGRGCGRRLLAALENDPLFTQAERVWLTSSTMALGFYERMGYQYVGGFRSRNNSEGLIYMEKHPQKTSCGMA